MASPAPEPDPAHAGLLKSIGYLPGGQYIAPHYNDGPYYLVFVEDEEEPNWMAEAVMGAYPPRRVLVQDMAEEITFQDAYALPEFSAEMLDWHSVENELTVNSDRRLGPFPEMPGDAQILPFMAALLGYPPVDDKDVAHPDNQKLQEALAAAGNAHGLETLMAALSTMGDTLYDVDKLTGAVGGLFTPVTRC